MGRGQRSSDRTGRDLLEHTHALGARHAGYGVRAADYRTVGDSLLAALAAVLGDSFDDATREAWVIAYNLVAETMLEGAASARPIGTGNRPATWTASAVLAADSRRR